MTSPNLQLPPFCVFKNATFYGLREKQGLESSLTQFFSPMKRSKISALLTYSEMSIGSDILLCVHLVRPADFHQHYAHGCWHTGKRRGQVYTNWCWHTGKRLTGWWHTGKRRGQVHQLMLTHWEEIDRVHHPRHVCPAAVSELVAQLVHRVMSGRSRVL